MAEEMSISDRCKEFQVEINNVLMDPTHPYHDKMHPSHKQMVEDVQAMYGYLERHGPKKPGGLTFEPKIGLRLTLQGKNR